jgi:hypothetical protein
MKIYIAVARAHSGITNPKDYLVVGSKNDKSTWHLPIAKNGKLNHRLMGAAWAALTFNFRGNQYKGPGKAGAIKKLKALYASENMQLPLHY